MFIRKVRVVIFIMIFPIYAFSFVATVMSLLDDVYRASSIAYKVGKEEFVEILIKNPYAIKSFSALSKYDRMKLYMGISKVPMTKQTYYLSRFNKIEGGDKLLIDAVKNNKNIDDVLANASKTTKTPIRRITNIEKEFLTSRNATKQTIFGRTVVQRNVFECSRTNIALMLKGRSPFGIDGKRVNLHHLKQQKDGLLIEMTQTEHNSHSATLHRYVKAGSEISDRNSDFMNFRQKYWKYRAAGCIARGK